MALQLYREGRIIQAYAGQQHSYQSNAQRTGEEEAIFPGIGVECTLLRTKIVEISKKQLWKMCASYVKKKGTDDAFKIYTHTTQANVFLIEAATDVDGETLECSYRGWGRRWFVFFLVMTNMIICGACPFSCQKRVRGC